MSQYYSAKRSRYLYDTNPIAPFRLSRSKVDLFLECPRCFYLDRRLGIGRPPGYPFSLNSAVDTLLKKEFDAHRAAKTVHPLTKEFGLDLVPFQHEYMEEWRDSLRRGITYAVPETNIVLTGGVDDVWVDPTTEELVIVDYKATSKDGEVSLDADWQIGYKRQMEVYQWLFRRNGFKVSNTGYFVYCNGRTDGPTFDARLEFDIKLIPYTGNDNWVERTVRQAHTVLCTSALPAAGDDCDYCAYYQERRRAEEL
jgi:PD-(D/E)XK nuclease superfamily